MLEVIAILVLIFIALRLAVSFFLPLLIKRFLNNYRKKFYQQNPGHAEREQKGKGRVSISFNRKKTPAKSDNLGDYTTFEDIKDK